MQSVGGSFFHDSQSPQVDSPTTKGAAGSGDGAKSGIAFIQSPIRKMLESIKLPSDRVVGSCFKILSQFPYLKKLSEDFSHLDVNKTCDIGPLLFMESVGRLMEERNDPNYRRKKTLQSQPRLADPSCTPEMINARLAIANWFLNFYPHFSPIITNQDIQKYLQGEASHPGLEAMKCK